jgi:Holliday junction DNA helicase RuvA
VIGLLRGTVADRSPKGEVIVDVNGIGYRVSVTTAALASMPVGSAVTLHVHTHVREDALVLYGFPSRDARTCFEVLIGTHGVGPSLALAILSSLSPDRLRVVVADADEAALTAVPGIGKKTAARLLVELGGRFEAAEFDDAALSVTPGSAAADDGGTADGRVTSDVRAALAELGYGADEVRAVLRRLAPGDDAPSLLRAALRMLAEGRR